MTPSTSFTPDERKAILTLGSLYSFRMLGLFMVLPVLGLYAADMPGATPETLGIALGAYGLTQAMLQLPLGWLSDRIGRRPVVIGGLLLFIGGSFIAASAESIYGIIAGRFIQGGGAIAAALAALAADYTRDSQRTKAMAVIGASVGISFVLAIVLGPAVASRLGLGAVFLFTACLGLIGLIIVLVALPAVPEHSPSAVQGEWEVAHVLGGGLPVLYLSVFLLHGLMMAAFLIAPKALTDGLGVPPAQHSILYLVTVMLSIAPALFIMKKGRDAADPRLPIMVAIVPFSLGVVLVIHGASLWLVVAGFILLFTGINALEALLPATVSRLAPGQRRGTAMGCFATSQFLGIFVGGTAGGVALGAGGASGVLLLVVCCLCLWAVMLWMRPLLSANPANFSE